LEIPEQEPTMNITINSTLREILRARPLAIRVLEGDSGHKCWEHLDLPLAAFCEKLGLDSGSLFLRVNNLPAVPPDTDWPAKPLYHLIDHLTRGHREFRDQDLPSIAGILATGHLPAYPQGYVVKLLVQEFEYFRDEFLKHMDEEETFLFPKIMRNEACFRHPQMGPEIHKGSVNLYLRLENHKPENEFKRMLTSIRDKLRNQMVDESVQALAAKLQSALESFESRLVEHADLETNVLFPLAGRLEQELYEGAAPGVSRYPGDR
jgi:iron-sulfur cluster repair protein YtfE (RIC family)